IMVPTGSVDPWSDKVLRAGMGAHFRLPLRDGLSWEEITPLLAGLTVRLAAAGSDVSYDDVDWTIPSALIVGGEARGAGRVAQQRADQLISIPMANEVESLNAAVAGSVILFEALRQRRA
ncbi:MAG: TrmH family RNA methyltransferase, partial [Ardenticatenaceae bacterium]